MERETLEKSISFRSYVAVGLGAIIGIGWLIYSGQWIMDGGPVGAILAFIICGAMLLPIGMCYAELTSAFPVAGGELAFSYAAFGALPSFLTAWALCLSYVAITPFETIAIGVLFETIVPQLESEPLYEVGGYGVGWSGIIPGLLTGALLIWLNRRGLAISTRIQTWIVYTLTACSAVFIITALLNGDFARLAPMFASGETAWAAAPASIISVLVVAPYFMAGFDTIPQAAEEAGVSMKPQHLGVAILMSIILGATFYVLIILAVGVSISTADLAIMLERKDVMPTAEVFRAAFGFEWAAKLVLFVGLLGLISTLNGFYIASSRLLFSMGRGGLLPHWFAEVHKTYQTPANAVLFVGVLSLAGPFIGQSAFIPIINSGSLTFALAMMMTCLSAIWLRSKRPELQRPYRTGAAVLGAAAAVSAMLVALMVVPGSPGLLSPLEFQIISGWAAVGLMLYLLGNWTRKLDKRRRTYLILGEQ